MRSAFNLKIILRILAPLLLAPLLGLGARPHSLERDLHLAGSAMQASARPEKHMAASLSLARLAAQNPWRTDLWEPAGRQALLGGDAQAATRHLEHAAAAGSLSAQGRLALDRPACKLATWRAPFSSGKTSAGQPHPLRMCFLCSCRRTASPTITPAQSPICKP